MKTDKPQKPQEQKQEERGNKHTLLKEVYENVSRETFFKPEEISEVLKLAQVEKYLIKTKGIELYNICASFDIETFSWRENDQKRAIMYVWQFCVNGLCIVGRTWQEFDTMICKIVEALGLYEKRRLFCFIHNLAYEFQFIKERFTWLKVFAVDERKPVYAIADNGIEFRCSYILSGFGLATLAKNLQYKIKKLDTLNYSLARNYKTPISKQEMLYCLVDVKIVVLYLAELLQTEWNLNTIPLTNTGFVRRFVRECCFVDTENKKNTYKRLRYNEMMSRLTMNVEEYQQLKRAFQGGFTHASTWYSGKLVHNATSRDETSAYPYVMVAMQYPMGAPEHITIKNEKDFLNNLKLYCCCFDICFEGLEATTTFENYISVSRCWCREGIQENNGRVVCASKIWTTITEQDFLIIKRMYKWKKCKVANFMRFKRDYLPRDFVKAVLTLYADKTKLKDVEGVEREYLAKKGMLNSTYGMSVTDPVRDLITYEQEWKIESQNPAEILDKYNNDKNRFLYYPWGVWVTAYARKRLLDAILAVGENDYLYSDTDSVKFLNPDKHQAFFDAENQKALDYLSTACKYHHLPEKYIKPKTVKGKEKPLGVWDFDGDYKSFKALRAKSYMYETYDSELHLTNAGLNKKKTVPWFIKKWGDDNILGFYDNRMIFEHFADGLTVPAEATGKNTHTYVDHEISGALTDYLGNTAEYHELSFVHLEEASYDLSLTEEYKSYILVFATEQAPL